MLPHNELYHILSAFGWMHFFRIDFHHGNGGNGEGLQDGTRLPPIRAYMDVMTTLTTTAFVDDEVIPSIVEKPVRQVVR